MAKVHLVREHWNIYTYYKMSGRNVNLDRPVPVLEPCVN